MQITGKITKLDEDKFLAFGWASVAQDADGKVIVDSQGDTISIEELEKTAYNFVCGWHTAGEMHERYGVAELVESVVFTPEKIAALGLEGKVPVGWWTGWKNTESRGPLTWW